MNDLWSRIISLFNGTAKNGFDYALGILAILIVLMTLVCSITSIILAIKYIRYNRRANSANMTGEEVARRVLDENGLQHIKVKAVGSILFGNSYSHYFKKVRLRRLTRHKTSITSLGMGAQKACLAILDKEGDKDMRKRIRLIPLTTFGPFAFIPLVVVGVILDIILFHSSGIATIIAGSVGILFFLFSFLLCLMTLKTEKKAQQRAYKILKEDHLANDSELNDLQKLFKLYNTEYVNDTILSMLKLLYYVLLVLSKVLKKDS